MKGLDSMRRFCAEECRYRILSSNPETIGAKVFPYLKAIDGDKSMFLVGPQHGRSFVVGKKNNGRYVVSKGNGLSYTQLSFINTHEMGSDTWGLLLKQDAQRDLTLGMEIESLGIRTNQMEYVLELDKEICLDNEKENILKPVLLQYNIECPYRISDAPFMDPSDIGAEVAKWQKFNIKGFKDNYMIAADILIGNLRILHDHQILHNAIHIQNYTWALELLDFELSASPAHPYDNEDYLRHVPTLFSREIIQTYEVIIYIAGCLREDVSFSELDNLFANYNFNLKDYSL